MIPEDRIRKVTDSSWDIPREFRSDMRVPARVFADEAMLRTIRGDRSLEQLVNVATLPGIQKYALAMPDIHEGYGFPVGGVAAFHMDHGVISPGGIGYDINCGVRLLRTAMSKNDIMPHVRDLGRRIFSNVPSGVGRAGMLKLEGKEFDAVLEKGVERMLELGYAEEEDLAHIESGGKIPGADPALVSVQAKRRGHDQLGTMGAGNHFVEVDYVETVFDPEAAERLQLSGDQITVLIHTGSRGLGHQVATDYVRLMNQVMAGYGITLPDRELACAPIGSREGRQYFAAMNAAANFAWANRQLITYEVRNAFAQVFKNEGRELSVVYDVAHNIAKKETYEVGGARRDLMVHRKGATRAFPGQPVLIPGSMGTASYVLLGTERSLTESFGSSCHGAGRRMSRGQARREVTVRELRDQLSSEGIVVNAGSDRGLAEEAPLAYKDVNEVVDIVHKAGIATRVARLRPLVVVKG